MHRAWRILAGKWWLVSLAGLTATSMVLYGAGAISTRSLEFSYLPWNLFLAWLPLLLSLVVLRSLRRRLWTNVWPFCLTLLWLILLPNTFYMISDFIHLQDVAGRNLLFDVVLFTSFIATGTFIGFTSLSLVHAELEKRFEQRTAAIIVGCILLLCSFAIYLGRDLRWNSWDVFLNPAGILFDVSDHLFHPLQHGDLFTTTLSFFVLLGSFYTVQYEWLRTVRLAGPEGRAAARGAGR